MILVDTSIWVDYFRGVETQGTRTLDRRLESDRVATGDLIVAEIMMGFTTKRQIDAAYEIISCLECFDLAGREIALKAADNYRFLRSRGITVRKTIDMIIGTFCIENKIPLLHNDRDFEPMIHYLGLVIV
ncbi:MAG: PIN domain nuclease [Chitinispirillaceae bacterium]|nr:PIN domain nuclease [Chitinispirillaceae bacterium]